MSRSDERIEVFFARSADEFAKGVNGYLAEGGWRVAETFMSACDNDYQALLIKAAPEVTPLREHPCPTCGEEMRPVTARTREAAMACKTCPPRKLP